METYTFEIVFTFLSSYLFVIFISCEFKFHFKNNFNVALIFNEMHIMHFEILMESLHKKKRTSRCQVNLDDRHKRFM